MSVRFGYDTTVQRYRAYSYPWIRHPSTKPDVVACSYSESGKTAMYVNWNGATDVQSWKVYSGSNLKPIAKRNDFETTILVDGLTDRHFVVVEAVGGVGDGTRSD
ncbi:hypothetical protein BGW36DRAFT_379779 [Talaromyces proteolyticus]|uniref:Uncharacterized protein n=1 Tax=Talaromyces proteolyticus TaxID=1131652 RepID=A0AAD4KTL6_9EURO|nr:uncharacterized protein BGW36DRAFT_379779 [Talaromyces proteolyticus]KAH8697977.1 hypothetical protein BGW36DRAFT_379779 [Talaromyces proteolyticus]